MRVFLAIVAIATIKGNMSLMASAENKGISPLSVVRLGSGSNVNESLKNALVDSNQVPESASVSADGIDLSRDGLQAVNVTASRSLASSASSVMVKVETNGTPEIRLKSKYVTVNNGDTFNAANHIAYINDDSGILPRIQVSGNVDMANDGVYPVDYTVTDGEGNSATETLFVSVQTHEEVIRAREEAERLAREEEERRLREEEERRQREEEEKKRLEEERLEEERQRQLVAEMNATEYMVEYDPNTTPATGRQGSYNPYGGGWSNCTWSAWTLANQYAGVSLPSWGWAGSWLANASADGWITSSDPSPYSIAVYSGHVALVTAVEGDMVYIKEGGFLGGYNERWVYVGGSTQTCLGYIWLHN